MRRSFVLVTVQLLLASVALADVDKVTLKNGDRFSGTILSGDGKTRHLTVSRGTAAIPRIAV